jgi:hypothetical protein
LNTNGGKIFIKKLTRGTNEGNTGKILLLSGRFSYEHKLCAGVANSENEIRARFSECAFHTRRALCTNIVQ